MPPKAKITKRMILDAALTITREEGFAAVNARRLAQRLECSTQPIFTCYQNMDALKKEFLLFAYEFYEHYVAEYRRTQQVKPYLLLPLSYIQFAQEETRLFQLLFVEDMDLRMEKIGDFYHEIGNDQKAREFSKSIDVDPEIGKTIFLELFLYCHGIAVLTASGKLRMDQNSIERMITDTLSALVKGRAK